MSRQVLIIVCVVIGVLVIGAVAAAALLSPGQAVQAARAKRKEIRQYVDEQGKTTLPRTYLVTMPFAGRIEPIELNENDQVEEGQVVARVNQEDLESEVAEARAAVATLQERIEENADVRVWSGARQQALQLVKSMEASVAAAETRVSTAEERFKYAESFLARTRRLFDQGSKSQDDLDRAELQYQEAKFDYSQEKLIVAAAEAMQVATELMPTMVSDYIKNKELSGDVLASQKSEAEVRLEQALLTQTRGTLTAPTGGVVLDRAESNRRYLPAGEVLLSIGNLDELEVEVDVLSQDAGEIKPGDEVEIYGPATGRELGEGYRGRVQRVNYSAFEKISSLGVEQQRVIVVIRFADGELARLREARRIGVEYRVRVRIFTRIKSEALVVPRTAVFRAADGGWQVFAIEGGAARRVPVEIGISNDDHVEITKGLSPGGVVVLAPESSLEDGSRVSPVYRD